MSEFLDISKMALSADTAIAIINDSKSTHEEWLIYYQEHPEEVGLHDEAGSIKHQEYCIAKYNKAIKCIESLQEELTLTHVHYSSQSND